MKVMAEYIWIDGHEPTANLRSKTKILSNAVASVADLPSWGFDGSSTLQAEGTDSDCMLKPVWFCKDPLRGGDNVLVMNEVYNPDGSPHKSNTRTPLVELAEKFKDYDPWFGIEQEYILMNGKQPLGWPTCTSKNSWSKHVMSKYKFWVIFTEVLSISVSGNAAFNGVIRR
jgi:glutamine synthetase